MKKITVMIALLLPLYSQAQFTKGDKVLGGTLGLSIRNQDTEDGIDYQTRNFSVLPNLGFFVNDKLELGGILGYDASYQNFEESSISLSNTYKSQSLTTGLYAQHYYTVTDKFLFSIQLQSSFSRGNSTSPQFDQTTGEVIDVTQQHYSIQSSLLPTFHFFPSAQWDFTCSLASLGHAYRRNLSNDDKTNQFGLSYGGVNLGVSYYFRKLQE